MSSVMIRCPNTGRSVSTAIEIEASVFSNLPEVSARMHCPACGQEHVWAVSSAWLANEPRLVRPERPTGSEAA
jgi:predicted RNA-binding Zn-ribbon protein involved in translation (DUF1610 family)